MIVFTIPIKNDYRETVGKSKHFVSAQEVKIFEIDEILAGRTRVCVKVGYTSYEIPFPNMETAEKNVREAIEAIMRDEDYEFHYYEGI